MKRIITLLLSLMLLAVPFCATADNNNSETLLKIGLFFGSNAKWSYSLGSESGFSVTYGEGETAGEYLTLGPEITVTVDQQGFMHIEDVSFLYITSIKITPISGISSVDGAKYRGSYILNLADNGMTLINLVNIEEYLYSVIGKEMSPSWNIEALKCQAICARTYALANLGKYSKYGFDLDTTQNCQVYPGVSSEAESTILATEATRGLCIYYDGKLIEALYSSSDGGVTDNSENVWGSFLPYLRSVVDIYEKPGEGDYYTWETVLTKERITELVNNCGDDIGDIVSVKITKFNPSGRAAEVTITGTKDKKVIEKSSIRSFFGLKSQYFKILGTSSLLDVYGKEITEDRVVLTAKGNAQIAMSDINILGTYGAVSKYTDSAISDSVTFSGGGWGHGLGMSQWGAKAMADTGFGYLDIIHFYYTGVDIY